MAHALFAKLLLQLNSKKIKLLFVNRKKNANSCKNMGYWEINSPEFKIHKNGSLMTPCVGFRKETK